MRRAVSVAATVVLLTVTGVRTHHQSWLRGDPRVDLSGTDQVRAGIICTRSRNLPALLEPQST